MSQQPGWYDDPQDIEVLRYWDGVQWTNHTSPRQRPNLEQTRNARMGDHSAYGGSSEQSAPSEYASSAGYQPMPGGGLNDSSQPRTPDGQEVAGWWRRFFARIADYVLISILSLVLLPLVAPDLMDTFRALVDAALATTPNEGQINELTNRFSQEAGSFALASAVLGFAYEILFLKSRSATPGKMLLGLRVRLRDQPGPLGWSAAGIRAFVWNAPSLLSVIPFLGQALGLLPVINGLWPLWDSKKQSLNDKAAKTNVVRKS